MKMTTCKSGASGLVIVRALSCSNWPQHFVLIRRARPCQTMTLNMTMFGLLVENCSGNDLPVWLSTRILEVERALGTLPSIAVFVDGEAQINKLVRDLQPLLGRQNIKIAGCADGRVVGDDQEVRVFDIQHIKGLEFEAVFFIGIDNLASKLDSLFDRYFYVGISRAATYLGVTCNGVLPRNLEPIRAHFRIDNWQ
jgi:hypothetical protein